MGIARRPVELQATGVLDPNDVFIVSNNTLSTPNSRKVSFGVIRDSTLQSIVTTSINRPLTPYVGQIIYETDTTSLAAFNGSTWTRFSAGAPVGAIMLWGTETAPEGWLLLDGVSRSRTTYAALYNIWGTRFGPGDGSTTFGFPNMRGRVPVGFNVADGDFNVIGKTGGAKTHTLNSAEIPAHTHTTPSVTTGVQSVNHNHTVGAGTGFVVTGGTNLGYSSTSGLTGLGSASNTSGINVDHAHTVPASVTGSTGVGGAHNNLQPFIALNFIVKT